MADIRKFTGYIAPDGSTHENVKKATEYTRDLKIRTALTKFAEDNHDQLVGFESDDHGNMALYPDQLPAFLYAHKEAIEAAFSQEVNLRAPRKPRAAKAEAIPYLEETAVA